MNTLKVGYAGVNINPPLGIGIYGYFVPRFAKGFVDDLEVHAMALSCGEDPCLLVGVDNGGINADMGARFRAAMAKAAGISADNIFLHTTHTHTGPMLVEEVEMFTPTAEQMAQVNRYVDFLEERLCDVAVMAVADMKPARMGFAVGHAPDRIAYIRRYKMKDGSTMTCPPINDPNIDHPIGELDQRVNVLRFDREGGESIVVLNYGLHADCVNGELICADWPHWVRKTIADTLDGTKVLCIVGAQGDVGSTHVYPDGGDMNDTEISFDNEMKSPGMARFIGRALAGTILQLFDKVEYIDVDTVSILHRIVEVKANNPKPEELPLAHKYKELHDAGRDDLIPYEAMELTTVVAEAGRMCRLENGPETFKLDVTGLRIGEVAFVGIPGEPFTGIGVGIKNNEGWRLIMPACLTNGNEGYFPMKDAFDEGGYEARSSNFVAGVAEDLIAGGSQLLAEMRK
ncbi:MAG: hypothetical protein IJB75_08190 [Oscillospiraceae bacterium]|nr:hypothetical protein [Oscillospiraceae bacterium]